MARERARPPRESWPSDTVRGRADRRDCPCERARARHSQCQRFHRVQGSPTRELVAPLQSGMTPPGFAGGSPRDSQPPPEHFGRARSKRLSECMEQAGTSPSRAVRRRDYDGRSRCESRRCRSHISIRTFRCAFVVLMLVGRFDLVGVSVRMHAGSRGCKMRRWPITSHCAILAGHSTATGNEDDRPRGASRRVRPGGQPAVR